MSATRKPILSRLLCLVLMLCMLPVAAPAESGTCSSVSAAVSFVRGQAEALAESFDFSYTSSMRGTLLGNDDALWDMLNNAGIFDAKVTYSGSRIFVSDITYYSGFKAYHADRMGKTELLSKDEKTILKKAKSIVAKARKSCKNDLAMEKYLHDYLISHVTYKLGKSDGKYHANDSAIGALKNGKAECDGYADAFYLLGRLGGLDVDLQSGTGSSGGGHMWDLVCLSGTWYAVDVTYDDPDYKKNKKMAQYACLNVGQDQLVDHSWYPALAAHATARYTDWDLFPYSAPNGSAIRTGYYFETVKDAAAYFYSQFRSKHKQIHAMVKGKKTAEAMKKAIRKKFAKRSYSYTFWCTELNGYTVFDIIFK